MRNFIKKPIVIISLAIVIVFGAVAFSYFGKNKKNNYNFSVATKGEIIQQVSATGSVKAKVKADLAFEKSGRIRNIYADVGDHVRAGDVLIALDNQDLRAQLQEQEASLSVQNAKLEELKAGTRPEDIAGAEAEVSNSEKSLKDVYQTAIIAAQKSAIVGKNSILVLTDIQAAHFSNNNQEFANISDAKASAIEELLGAENAGKWTNDSISNLSGGTFGLIQNAISDYSQTKIDTALLKTTSALQKIKDALGIVPTSFLTSAEKTNLIAEKGNINTEINTTVANQSTITTAQNNLVTAKSDMNIKKAGARPEQISAQEAQVQQASAQVENAKAQLAKTILVSPVTGVVTRIDIAAGEIAIASQVIVGVVSENNFEIETNVPEADIAKISIGNSAQVTLDAYGNDVVFRANVTAIDLAETIVEGVSTYKTTLQFEIQDNRVKPGMTANIDILTAKKANVIVIPQVAVTSSDGQKTVKILDGSQIKKVAVKTGLRGSDGNIEITDGVKEGDKVITYEAGQ